MELLSGGGFAVLYWFAFESGVMVSAGPGPQATFVVGGVLYSLALVMSVIDLEHMILPDKINLVGTFLGITFALTGLGLVTPASAALGAVVGYGILLIIVLVSRGGMGMGDAKFLAMIGTFVGPMGALYTLFVASVLGAATGGLLMAIGRLERRSPLPFGPFLAVAAIAVWVYMQIVGQAV